MRRKLYYAFFVALAMSSCVAQTSDVKSDKVVKCEAVRAYQPQRESVEYPARVESAKDVNLGFRVAGVIDGFAVEEGAFVRKGEPLVYMDRRDYETQLAATQAEYDGVKGEVDRVVAMYEEQSVAESVYDKALSGLRQITAKLEAHKNALSDATLVAPFDGYLDAKLFDRGESVAAGMPVARFVSAERPEVVVNLPAEEYMRRANIRSATASVKLFPDVEFPLRLRSFAPTANLNQLYAARFEVESQQGVTPPAGVTAMVTIGFEVAPEGSFVTALSSVVESNGGYFVWVVEDGKTSLRKVEVERVLSDGEVVLWGDLEVGEDVIVAGVDRLKEGESVKIMQSGSMSNVGNIL